MEFFLLFFVTMRIPSPELMCKGDKKKRGGGRGGGGVRQENGKFDRGKKFDSEAKRTT